MVLLISGEHEHCYRVDVATAPVGPPGASVQDNPSPPMTHRSTPLTSCLKASLNNTILLECLSKLSFHKLLSTTAVSVSIDQHSSLSSLLSSRAEK
ncbi:hypothetical protein DPMN_120655 [Dreissena polymorpha]|uniref:Uncharacterized protein n=1 Tax=Dreissena polymorpha TaxID=45954 RepID=A0A9D4GS00_DREPO|nr:hypothetical protein DPMN_120655 [Dreissena polymorpha]